MRALPPIAAIAAPRSRAWLRAGVWLSATWVCALGCAPQVAADVATRGGPEPIDDGAPADTAPRADTGLLEAVVVDDQEIVITSVSESAPVQTWQVEAGPEQWVTFRLVSPVSLHWQVTAPDGLPLSIYADGDDEVTHGKTGPAGGTFEVEVELSSGVSSTDVELIIDSEPL